MTSGGVISGTPTQRGSYTFSVRATDRTSPTAQFVDKGYTGDVQIPTLALSPSSATIVQGQAISFSLNAVGGVPPYSYLVEPVPPNALPPGLSLSASGVISGTPTAAGTFTTSIRVGESSTGPGTVFELETLTITVLPPPTVSIAVSPASVNEDGVTNLTYTVTRSAASASALTVNLTYSGTATSGTDYTGGLSTITIPANATTATLTIDPTADTTVEPNETVIVTVASGSGYTVGSPASATGTISNDEGTSIYCPTLLGTVAWGGSISINAGSCNAGFGLGVVLSSPTHGTATVGAFGANQPIIYTHNGISGTSDTFTVNDGEAPPNNQIRVNITITPPTSSIIVNPASLSTITAGAPFSQTITATGGTGPYTYSVTGGTIPPGLTLSTGGVLSGTATQRGAYSFTVRAQDSLGAFSDKGYSGTVAVPTLAITPTSATAVQNVPFSLNIAASGGIAPYSFLHEVVAGALPPGMSLSSTGVLSGTPTTVGTTNFQMRVTDSSTGTGSYFELENFSFTVSAPPTVSIAVSPASVSEDGATNLTYTVTRSLNLTSPTTVNITTAGTATSGSDYTGAVSTVVIPAGATTATFTIDPSVDGTVEPDETVTMTVAAGTGYTVGAPSVATGTILNDDVPSATIAVSPVNVAEDGAPNLVFTVTLSQANPSAATSIGYAVSGTATNGTDYATITSPLVIPAGATTGTITVNPTADATIETNETVILTLNAGAGYTVGVPAAATGTILNDDLPNLAINDVTLNEGNAGTTNATFTVSLSAPAGPGGVTFDIATANGSATAGTDYVANALTAQTIPAGSSTYTFTVLINGDLLSEPNETFFVNVTNVVNAVVVDGQGVGTLNNDDPLPSLSINDVTVVEGNSGTVNAVFTVTLSAVSGQNVTVNYVTVDGTATQPADYTSTSGTLTFTPGQTTRTITVPVIGETVPEANDTFFVNLSGATNATISDNQGLGTITNDDVPVIVSPASLPNGTVAAPYSQTLTASGGTAPYTFAVTAGALPPGLSLSPAGVLSGTPTADGGFNFTVTATDSSPVPGPFSGSRAYSLTMTFPPIVAEDDNNGSPVNGFVGGTAYANVLADNGNGADTLGGAPATLATVSLSELFSSDPKVSLAVGSGAVSVAAGTPAGTYTLIYEICQLTAPANCAPANVTVSVSAAPILARNDSNAANVSTATGGTAYANVLADNGNGSDIINGAAATFASVFISSTSPSNAGVSLNPATGAVTVAAGTPIGPQSVNYTICDKLNPTSCASAVASLTVVDASPIAANSSLTVAYNAAATNVPLSLSGGAATSLAIGTAPAHGTATVSGTTITYQPTAGYAGPDSFTYSATNSGGTSASATVSLTVQDPVITITPTGGFSAAVTAPYSQTFTFNGGAAPWSGFQVTNLPAGLSITGTTANTVTVSGTPTQAGTFNLNVSATDSSTGSGPYTVGQAFALTVSAPTLSLAPAAGTLNAPYNTPFSQAFTASGGTGPYSYALTGALPAGLAFSGGTLSGTPTAPGSYTVTVTATDTGSTGTGAPFTVAQTYTINVPAPTIVLAPASLPNPVVAAAYSQTLTASGGAAPYSYAVTAGSLPSGLALSSGGVISGTSYAVGSHNFTVTATDANGQTGARAYELTIAAPVLTMTPSAGTLTVPYAAAYSQAFTAAGGSGSYSYALTGTLPAGLSFSGGTISGTPTVPGSYPVTITATDTLITGLGAPYSIAQNYTINVPAPTIVVGPATLPDPTLGNAYSQTLSASGGAISYSFAITAGSLPSGISLGSSGTLTGTSFQVGTFNFTVTATDGFGQTGSRAYSLTIAAPVLSMTPGAGTLTAPYNTAFSQAFTAEGGTGNYSYALTGALPAGLSFSGGTISGTPTAPGSYPITVTATDLTATGLGAPFTIAQNYTLNVPAPTIVVTPASLGGATVGAAFTQGLSASGGAGPYTFALTGGALPAGVSLSGGTIAGTPTAAGSFNFAITATDANGQAGTRSYTLAVAAPNLAIAPASGALPISYATAFSRSFAASGGVGPYSYALTGTLPAGLSFNATTATVAGTPTTSGNFSFTVTATDTGSTGLGAPFTVSGSYTLAIAAPTITVTPSPLPNATAGQAYSTALVAAGAVAPYSFSLSSGTLPAGVTLSAAGQLAGTPTASGTFPFAVVVRDANGQQTTVNLSLTVNVPTLTVTPASLPGAKYGIAYSQALTVTGGIAPYSFALTSGALPTGVTLNPTSGLISGAPTAAGNFPFAVTVRDSTAGTAATLTVNYTLQVEQRPDPAQDPEVRGLVQAQAEATKRFATTQINNFQQRLERLHAGGSDQGGDDGNRISVTNTMRITVPDICRDAVVMANSTRCVQQRSALSQLAGRGGYNQAVVPGAGGGALTGVTGGAVAGGMAAGGVAAGGTATGGTAPGGDVRAADGGNGSAGASGTGSVGIWTAGVIRFGDQNAGLNNQSYEFESEGITIGADYRFSPDFAAGLGIGFGRDTVDIGKNGSRSRGEAKTVALYASYLPGRGIFIDGLVGYQWLDFDLRRYVTSTARLVDSQRSGHQWFGSVSLGADLMRGKWQLTPYARLDFSRARLEGYTESSGSVFDLTFLDQSVDSTTLGLGTRLRYSADLGGGTRLYPELKAEYLWQLDRNGDVLVTYADLLAGPYSALRLNTLDRDELVLGGKLDLELRSNWLFGVEYLSRFASGVGADSTVKVVISHEF
ncbi:MAG: putative Ig domain-containing protein [Sphingomonadaceae bacterium]|nr:putative Ig domain-containing protein [Sphingomonadaceae bacterium]